MAIARSTLALALAGALCSLDAGAEPPARTTGSVTLAEVTSRVEPGATRLGDVVPLLRTEAAAALATIDWSQLRLSRRYSVAATAVRLETTRTGDRTLVTACVVSASVRETDTGNLLFVVEGRARAEDSAAAAERAERDALHAAVAGAVRALPDGLRRAR